MMLQQEHSYVNIYSVCFQLCHMCSLILSRYVITLDNDGNSNWGNMILKPKGTFIGKLMWSTFKTCTDVLYFVWYLISNLGWLLAYFRHSHFSVNLSVCLLSESQQFSFLISGEYGRCYNEPKSLRVSGQNKIYNYQTHAG